MLFNSIVFIIFLIVVFLLYWYVFNKKLILQNTLLLVVSYIFYGWWDWRFLFLLAFSTFLDYYTGLKIHEKQTKKGRLFWLWLSISVNLGFLGVFKYYNFFINSFAEGLSQFGINAHFSTLQLILPVGISFYTFHGLSYVIDIYNRRIQPERNVVNYSVFVSFFPLLVAGPIERATHLLPQIIKKREFNYSVAVDGLRQILWGLFKKVVIADGAASVVDMAFNQYGQMPASTIVIGIIFFAFQIYGDFSGYSDIALGTAKLFGIDLLRNFAYPYFSRDIAEFWRRWHISLSSWFRDYVYIPLGGSKGGMWMKIRNTFIIFLLSGFWHGANWTFIVWGLLNALYFMPLLISNKNRTNTNIVAEGKYLPSIREFFQILLTFILTLIAWVFFRADSVSIAIDILKSVFDKSIFSSAVNVGSSYYFLLIGFIIIEWIQRNRKHGLELNIQSRIIRWAIYYSISILIFYFFNYQQSFIYFQF